MNHKLQSKLARKATIVAEIAKNTGLNASNMAVEAYKKIKGVYCKSINPFPKFTSAHRDFRLTYTILHRQNKPAPKVEA